MTPSQSPLSRTQAVIQELTRLHQQGCQEALLIDGDGLIVAAASESDSAQDTAALAAQVSRTAAMTARRAMAGNLDEIAINTDQGLKLVCRPLNMGGQPVTLVLTLPAKQRHRRLTNTAISAIERVWSVAGDNKWP